MADSRPSRPVWLVLALYVSAALAVVTVVAGLAVGRHPAQVLGLVGLAAWFGWMVRKQQLRYALIGLAAVVGIGVAGAVELDPGAGLMWVAGIPVGWFVREEQAWRLRGTLPRSREMWTGWRARAGQVGLVVALAWFLAAVVWTAVTVDSWGELVSFFGPATAVAVATLLGTLVVLVRQLWVRRRARRWSTTASHDVPGVLAAITAERGLDPSARPTGAGDESLDRARDHAEMAVLFLGSGPRLEAVQELERLLDVAQGWDAAAPLTHQVHGLEGLVRRGRRSRGQVDTELRRGPVRG